VYRLSRFILVLFLLLVAALPAAAQIPSPFAGCDLGTFDTGATWVICMPARLGLP
jgi:hypothetical protein